MKSLKTETMSQLSLYFKPLICLFVALSWTKWNIWMWGVWGVRWGEWPEMVCIIHRVELRISRQNHLYSPNSKIQMNWCLSDQDPSEHGSLCLVRHRLSASHFIRAHGEKVILFEYSKPIQFALFSSFYHPWCHKDGLCLSIMTCHKSRVACLISFYRHLFTIATGHN